MHRISHADLRGVLYTRITHGSTRPRLKRCLHPALYARLSRHTIREFRFLTKIPAATIQEDVKAIFRRHLIKLSQKDERIYCRVVDSELMRIFADYQQSIDSGKDFIPYKLSILQKRLLIFLAPLEMTEPKTSPEWISFIQEKFKDVEVSQWINLLKLEWFRKVDGDNDRYEMDKKTIRYFLKALRYETNIRGVL